MHCNRGKAPVSRGEGALPPPPWAPPLEYFSKKKSGEGGLVSGGGGEFGERGREFACVVAGDAVA
jgi:hypothetical protein